MSVWHYWLWYTVFVSNSLGMCCMGLQSYPNADILIIEIIFRYTCTITDGYSSIYPTDTWVLVWRSNTKAALFTYSPAYLIDIYGGLKRTSIRWHVRAKILLFVWISSHTIMFSDVKPTDELCFSLKRSAVVVSVAMSYVSDQKLRPYV